MMTQTSLPFLSCSLQASVCRTQVAVHPQRKGLGIDIGLCITCRNIVFFRCFDGETVSYIYPALHFLMASNHSSSFSLFRLRQSQIPTVVQEIYIKIEDPSKHLLPLRQRLQEGTNISAESGLSQMKSAYLLTNVTRDEKSKKANTCVLLYRSTRHNRDLAVFTPQM